jgi:glycosyltransferase involved in cell wall biosynthesis
VSELHGVLVTYRRTAAVELMLERVATQTQPLRSLVLVDNDPCDANRSAAAAADPACGAVTYVAAPENLGPAGGIALGLERVLAGAADDDWCVLLDDDDPPPDEAVFADLLAFAQALPARAGAVGLAGARLDRRRGRMVRVPDGDLHGAVPVDYLGGNQCPVVRLAAVRDAGVFEPRLFFGFEELEFGLRLQRHGWGLYGHGDRWRARRADLGRLDMDARPDRAVGPLSWRRFYSLRNLVWVLRADGRHRAALEVALVQGVGKPALNLVRAPRLSFRHLRTNVRASVDGWRGALGRTREPGHPAVADSVR